MGEADSSETEPADAGGSPEEGDRRGGSELGGGHCDEDENDAKPQIFILAASSRPDLIDSALLRPGRIEKHVYVGLPNAMERNAILLSVLCNYMSSAQAQAVLQQLVLPASANSMTPADLSAVVNSAHMLAVTEFLAHKEAATRRSSNCIEAAAETPVQLSARQGIAPGAANYSGTVPIGITPTSSVGTIASADHTKKNYERSFSITLEHLQEAFYSVRPSLSREELDYYDGIYRKFKSSSPVSESLTPESEYDSESSDEYAPFSDVDGVGRTKDRHDVGIKGGDSIVDGKSTVVSGLDGGRGRGGGGSMQRVALM